MLLLTYFFLVSGMEDEPSGFPNAKLLWVLPMAKELSPQLSWAAVGEYAGVREAKANTGAFVSCSISKPECPRRVPYSCSKYLALHLHDQQSHAAHKTVITSKFVCISLLPASGSLQFCSPETVYLFLIPLFHKQIGVRNKKRKQK